MLICLTLYCQPDSLLLASYSAGHSAAFLLICLPLYLPTLFFTL